MSDTSAPPATAAAPPAPPASDGRAIRTRRSLPGGRAVVGAFLVVVAAVGTFGAYLQATAVPDTSYIVATRPFEIGHVITDADLVGAGAGFEAVPMELPDQLAINAFTPAVEDAEQLRGRVVVAPIAVGELLQRSDVVDEGTAGSDGVSMSFSLPVDRALGGAVSAGERLDVVATYPAARDGGSETRLVARGVVVISNSGATEGLNGGAVTLTVQVPDLATAQRVQNAVDVANVALLRGGDPDEAVAPVATDAGDRDDTDASPTGGGAGTAGNGAADDGPRAGEDG